MMICRAHHKTALLLGVLCSQSIWAQQFNAMPFQAHSSPYSYPPVQGALAQNLLRPQQVQQMQEQQPVQQRPVQLQQQLRDQQNAALWREAEEEEARDEEREQAAIQQKKQQQLMQLRQQEQAHTAPPSEYKGMWTSIQAAVPSVSLQTVYNMMLFAIASSAVAFSLRTHVASALDQAKAATKASLSSKSEVIVDEAPSEQIQEDPKTAVALPQEQETLVPKSPTPTAGLPAATKSVAHVPRAPAERAPPTSKESTPLYLCEATFHKYDGIDALQKALKIHSQRVAQGDGNCILIAGNPGKEAASIPCAQQ